MSSFSRESAGSQAPSPLRIVKRSSSQTEDSRPEPAGEGFLTVMKRRMEQSRLRSLISPDKGDCDQDSLQENQEWRFNWGDAMMRDPGVAGSQSLKVRKTRRRPFINGRGPSEAQTFRHLGTEKTPGTRGNNPRTSFPSFGPVPTRDSHNQASSTGRSRHSSSSESFHPETRPTLPKPPKDVRKWSRVLSPHVAVTADTTSVGIEQKSLWVAVQVSGRLSEVSRSMPNYSGSFIDHALDRYFEYGCLYDLTIDILPTPGVSIVQLLREQTFPTTIYAGSSILVLAQIHLDSNQVTPTRTTHVRQKSEELIEDLEIQLGSSQIPYMQIRITYCHSAFPEYSHADRTLGVSSMGSRMETTAVAILKRQNSSSLWSPRPAPSSNPLFSLIEKHWGVDKAQEAMQQILNQRSTPRKPATTSSDLSPIELGPEPARVVGAAAYACAYYETCDESLAPQDRSPPPVPMREASLQSMVSGRKSLDRSTVEPRQRALSRAVFSHGAQSLVGSAGGTSSPSRPSCASMSPPSSASTRPRAWPGNASPFGASGSSSSGCDGPSPIPKRRSLGREGIRGLVPLFSDLASDGRNRSEKVNGYTADYRVERAREKKSSTKWTWTNWF